MVLRTCAVALLAVLSLVGCGSIAVSPPPGMDSGDTGSSGDPGSGDTVVLDLPEWTSPDPGQDGAPIRCETHDDCKAMPGLGPCIVGRCDPVTGTCWHVMLSDGMDCDDGDPCTAPDWCANGTCVGQGMPCDDHNPCTVDFCNEAGLCATSPFEGTCDDGDDCTIGDQCLHGQCVGEPLDCDDQDPCTDDRCQFGCIHVLRAGCKPCKSDAECDDGNPCTKERCQQDTCQPIGVAPDGEVCAPNDPCALDAKCQGGQCVPTLIIVCDDGKICTEDFCVNGKCFHTPLSGPPCNDANPCTQNDICQNGNCVGGKPVNCDDKDPCTKDSCLSPKDLCPGVSSLGDPANYKCCHVGCSEPNPTCTPTGCRCGKGTCDPVTADQCILNILTQEFECKCGLGVACKPGYCCTKGQCMPGPCLVFPR